MELRVRGKTIVRAVWSDADDVRYALYSSLSPGLQTYLEGLTAVHSSVAKGDGYRAAGLPVRRQDIETTQLSVCTPLRNGRVFTLAQVSSRSLSSLSIIQFHFQDIREELLAFRNPSRTRYWHFCSAKSVKIPITRFASNGSQTHLRFGITEYVLSVVIHGRLFFSS